MSKILITDIETTSVDKKKGHIVEIALVSLDLTNGKIDHVYSGVTHEDGITKEEIEKSWIYKNSTPQITVEEIRHSPNLKRLLRPLYDEFNSEKYIAVTGWNILTFDVSWFKDRGIHIKNLLNCPMKALRYVIQAKDKNGNIKAPSVEDAYKFYFKDGKYKERHRAYYDCVDEAKIIYAAYKAGHYKILKV